MFRRGGNHQKPKNIRQPKDIRQNQHAGRQRVGKGGKITTGKIFQPLACISVDKAR